jgi:glucan phosphoethanolaminetransferase (alkaline phosphatase superfamily)
MIGQGKLHEVKVDGDPVLEGWTYDRCNCYLAAMPMDPGPNGSLSPPVNDAKERRYARINALYVGLLGVIGFWTFVTLRDPEQQVVRSMTTAQQALCFVQPLLLWTILGLASGLLLAKAPRAGWKVVPVLINFVAVIFVIDSRCKHLFFQPLSWEMSVTTMKEANVLLSAFPIFFGKTFWWMALGSIVLMNLLMLSARSGFLRRLLVRLPIRPCRYSPAIILAVLLTVGSIFLPLQPSQLEQAVFINAVINPIRVHKHSWAELGTELADSCEQKAFPVPELLDPLSHPLGGLAKGRNVVLYIGESWAFKHTSLADPIHDFTPVARRLAEIGPISTVARAQSSFSTKSIYGLLTGRYSSPSIEIVESLRNRLDSFARVLSEQGYDTAFASTQQLTWQNIRNQFATMGFAKVLGEHELRQSARRQGRIPQGNSFGLDDAELLQDGILPPVSNNPFFVTYYNMNTHTPYFVTGGQAPNERQVDYFHRALRYSDSILGKIIDQLQARRQWDNTVLVVVGDHGENFAEDGGFSARQCALTESELLVPLVIVLPGLSPELRQRFNGLTLSGVRQIDVAPTLLHLMGIKTDIPMQGRSLLANHELPPAYVNSYGTCKIAGLVDRSTKYLFDFLSNSAWKIRLEGDSPDENLEMIDGPSKEKLGLGLKACAQYNDSQIRQ